MSAQIRWKVADAAGNANTSAVVKLYILPADTEYGGVGGGTLTSNGDGTYSKDVPTTGKYRLRVDGSIKQNEFFHIGDDAYSFLLQRNGLVVDIVDTADRFTNVQLDPILTEIPTFAELAATISGKGASLISIEDALAYYSETTVEGALQALGALKQQLNGLTSTAAELNKLDGASGNVNASNLNQLTGGSTTALHGHQMATWFDQKIGYGLTADDPIEFVVEGTIGTDTVGRGPVVLNTYHATGVSSRAKARRKVEGGTDPHDYIITDEWVAADTNFSGDPLLGQVTGPDKHGEAIKRLSATTRNMQIAAGINYAVIASLGQRAGSADTNSAADPRATTLYYDKTATYVRKERWPFIQMPESRVLSLRTLTKSDVAGAGYIKIVIGSQSYELKIVPTTFTECYLAIDLKQLPVTVATFRDVELWLHGDGAGNGASMASYYEMRVEI